VVTIVRASALIVFQEAAEKEQVTAALTERLGAYLRRARSEPGLRFEVQRACEDAEVP
jgi:hypothetical protein